MLQGVHAVAGLTPRTAYLSHTQDAAPSPRTTPNVGARLLSGSLVTCPPDLTLQNNTPCASSTFALNLHLLALVPPFPFLSTGRPLDCAFLT